MMTNVAPEIIGIGTIALTLISALSGLILKILKEHKDERQIYFKTIAEAHEKTISMAESIARTTERSIIALDTVKKSVDEQTIATRENSRVTQETGRLTRDTKDAFSTLMVEVVREQNQHKS